MEDDEKQFWERQDKQAMEFAAQLIERRHTDKYAFAVLCVLAKAVQKGRSRDMFDLVKGFYNDDLNSFEDWLDTAIEFGAL